ncbi:MAG: lipid II flippase MurJ, partial [Acidobacteriota bacterium]
AVAGRGVVQISLYIDGALATLLAAGAPGVINYSAILINLPVAIFGISVAAAELPELSRAGSRAAAQQIADRIERGIRQSTFMIAPSVIGYLCFGFLVVGLLYRGGSFGADSQWLTTAVLAAYTLGLIASAVSRLLQNAFFAVGDTRTPARISAARLVASVAVGLGTMFWLDGFSVSQLTGVAPSSASGRSLYFGACGLALGASFGAWTELLLLARFLKRRLPELRIPLLAILGFLGSALVAALPAFALWWLLREQVTLIKAPLVLGAYAGLYLGAASWRGSEELTLWVGRFRKKR